MFVDRSMLDKTKLCPKCRPSNVSKADLQLDSYVKRLFREVADAEEEKK